MKEVIFSAPGAGLGHLLRCSALCLALKKYTIPSRIITNSIFAEGCARITGLYIDYIASKNWTHYVLRYFKEMEPSIVVLDSFPWGLRGEWRNTTGIRLKFIYLARRLNVRTYLETIGMKQWDIQAPQVQCIITLEPLTPEHLALLNQAKIEIHSLKGRIRFPGHLFPLPIPHRLDEMLHTKKVRLVVHSGPLHEVHRLVQKSCKRITMQKNSEEHIALILPFAEEIPGYESFAYFPAQNLYPLAYRIVTAAGYNSVAETTQFKKKRILLPLKRTYDDQCGRIRTSTWGSNSATERAAEIIASHM